MKAVFFAMGEHISEIAYTLLSRHHAFLFTDVGSEVFKNISIRMREKNVILTVPKISERYLEVLGEYIRVSRYENDIAYAMAHISSFLRGKESEAELYGTLAWLEEYVFSDKDKRRMALEGFLAARSSNCHGEAEIILKNRSQGPGVRIWNLSRLINF